MVVKVYISGISGNKEVKKRQQRVLMILDSKNIKYDVIDITEPGREADKEFMQNNAKSNGGTVSDPNPRSPLPPQLFSDEEYCGDYDQFDLANEMDTLEVFLKMEAPPEEPVPDEKANAVNGDVEKAEESDNKSKENSQEREAGDGDKPAKEVASKEATPQRDATPAKEGTPLRDGTPAKDSAASKEGSPAAETEKTSEKGDSKETSPEKEQTPERQKSAEKEGTPSEKASSPEKQSDVESKQSSKESTPEKDKESVNENGTVSSRDQSEEKDAEAVTDSKKDTPSEALIDSEKAAAAE